MRTTVTVDAQLMDKAQRVSGQRSKTAAVNHILKEWLEREQREQLRRLRGKLSMDTVWRELRELEKQR